MEIIERKNIFCSNSRTVPYIIRNTYKNNILHGETIKFFANKQICEKGNYELGQKVGEWNYFHFNGTPRMTEIYKGGILTLEVVPEYNSQGKLISMKKYKAGKLINKIIYYSTGEVHKEYGFAGSANDSTGSTTGFAGSANGVYTEFFKSGAIRTIGYYVNSKKQGYWSTYTNDTPRQLISRISYLDDEYHGHYQKWYKNGNLKEDRYYFVGLCEGTSISYRENGSISCIEIFNRGTRLEKRIYTMDINIASILNGGITPAIYVPVEENCSIMFEPLEKYYFKCKNEAHPHYFDQKVYIQYSKLSQNSLLCPVDKTFEIDPQLFSRICDAPVSASPSTSM